MKLRDKKADVYFSVLDPRTGADWEVRPEQVLQRHQLASARTRPDMLLQFAHYLEEHWARNMDVPDAEIRVHACVSLNGRPGQLMIDPDRDLTNIERDLAHADWVLPLTTPFERPPERKVRRDISCT